MCSEAEEQLCSGNKGIGCKPLPSENFLIFQVVVVIVLRVLSTGLHLVNLLRFTDFRILDLFHMGFYQNVYLGCGQMGSLAQYSCCSLAD